MNDSSFSISDNYYCLSRYFIPTKHNFSQDEEIIKSHELSIKAGLIRKLDKGIYSWLPMGYRVIKKIEKIIIEEMEKIGAYEILMPSIHPAKIWKESGRYNDYGAEMLRIKDRKNNDYLFGPTHEEVITDLFRQTVHSYKTLPLHLMQIQWKFRDEIRPRHGVMRSREFLMKDSYSFDIDQLSAEQTYRNVFAAYLRIFKRIGLRTLPTRADSGAIGGNLSHEIQIISESGENKIFCNKPLEQLLDGTQLSDYEQHYIASDEYHTDDEKNYYQYNGIEVGHMFYFGTKYSKIMNAAIHNKKGELFYPHMGSYGIGVSRLVGAIIQASHDENGIIWPVNVAPFHVIIINLRLNSEKCKTITKTIYETLTSNHIDVIVDDTKTKNINEKIINSKILGIPYSIIIGNNYIKQDLIEINERKTNKKTECHQEKILEIVKI